MNRRFNLIFWLVAVSQLSFAQVTTNPALPKDNHVVILTFDASQGTAGLKDFTGDVYAHTGVITDKSSSPSDWKYALANWTTNLSKAKLTRVTANTYTLEISPDIRSFYGVASGETIEQMAFVFRNADGTREGKAVGGKDIFVSVYGEGLNVSISSPSKINIFEKNEPFTFTSSTTATADLRLFLNNAQIATQNGTSITQNVTIPDAGNYWLKAIATQSSTVKSDSVYVCIREATPNENQPDGMQTGINYIDNHTATLMVYAPGKQHIFVTGDFNDWFPRNDYQMNKDGDYFWLRLENLIPQKEYVFQYLIDGQLKVADIYTEKVSDPYDDKYISSTVYPNLIAYPEGKASDRASVLQTAQTPFQWSTPTYTIPEAGKLSVYELLIRDFTAEKTYKAVREKLGYLKRLGINTIELMPFNEFEGNNSWGYNPNFYFAPDKAYGTKEDLKSLIDEAHRQGFIVIQDMVLNHSYNSNPMVKMYWNDALNRPASDNPWFNETSPNTTYSWGADFNHESQATRDFVDRVNKYWLTEYKIDGFRFDFTKGFTNTPGDGGGYDAARIAILKRMSDKIWEVNPQAFVILEHFAPDREERELAAYGNGMLIWGNVTHNFGEAAMGYNESGKSDLSRASYQSRGYSKPGLLSYMESHDEERQLFKTLSYGNSFGAYNTKNLKTALERSRLSTVFFLSLAGPKMIWQFGELGYDYSINHCENGTINNNCRTDPKPLRWDYLEDNERLKLFGIYSAMLRLRAQYDVFTSGTETLSVYGEVKKIQLKLNDHNITLIGNFGMADQTFLPNFQHTGTWYEFFTGQEMLVSNVNVPLVLKAGEYRLYSDLKLPAFEDLATSVSDQLTTSEILVYPNPATGFIHVEAPGPIQSVELYSAAGQLARKLNGKGNSVTINMEGLNPCMYFLRVQTNGQIITQKVIKK